MNESSYLYVRRQARERLYTYESMALGRQLYEPTDVARAKLILPRVAELRVKGLELIDAVRIAEAEHPPVPLKRHQEYRRTEET